jgi:gliding motility-associated-like protein
MKVLLPIFSLTLICGMAWSQTCPSPVLLSSNNSSFCSGSGTLYLTIVPDLQQDCAIDFSTGSPYMIFLNNTLLLSSNQPVITIASPTQGEYTAKVRVRDNGTGNCPCATAQGAISNSSQPVTVYLMPTGVPLVSPNQQLTCPGGTAQFTVVNPQAQNEYLWKDIAGNLLHVGLTYNTQPLSSSTTYEVFPRNGACEGLIGATAIATVAPLIPPSILIDTIFVCTGTSTMIDAFSNTQPGDAIHWYATPGYSGLLNVGNTFTTPPILNPTTYYISLHRGSCASAVSSVHIIPQLSPQPNVSVPNQGRACDGDRVLLSASGGIGTYYWFSDVNLNTTVGVGNSYHTPLLDTTTSYWLQARESNGCRSFIASTTIYVNDLPNGIPVFSNSPVCEGDSIILQAANLVQGLAYSWAGPANFNSPTTSPVIPGALFEDHMGLYSLVVSDPQTGCSSLPESTFVTIRRSPQVSLPESLEMLDGETIQLQVSGGNLFTWFPADYLSSATAQMPYFTPPKLLENAPQSYILHVETFSNLDGCWAKDSIQVTVKPRIFLNIYNVITPNGDGKNDTWTIEGLYTLGQSFKIMIFDQNNNVVHIHDGDEYIPWNGESLNSKPLPTGLYKYVITDQSGRLFTTCQECVGTISIIND